MSLFCSQLNDLTLCFKKMTLSKAISLSPPKSSVIRGCPGFSWKSSALPSALPGLGGGWGWTREESSLLHPCSEAWRPLLLTREPVLQAPLLIILIFFLTVHPHLVRQKGCCPLGVGLWERTSPWELFPVLGLPEPHKDTRSAGLRGDITVPCTFFSPVYAVAALGAGDFPALKARAPPAARTQNLPRENGNKL